MPIPMRRNALAWLVGPALLCMVLTGFPLFFCQDVYASDNALFLTAMEKYYKGDISEALKDIRAYIKQDPSDLEAKVWKGFIRLEMARGLRESDRARSEEIANSESYETWALWNNTEEANEAKDENKAEDDGKGMVTNDQAGKNATKGVSEATPGLQSLWYAAMAKAYWLGRRTPISNIQAYTHLRTALRMDSKNVEALQIKGEMALDGVIDVPNFNFRMTQEEIDEYTIAAFEEELKVATKSHPEARMRALYWLALARCKNYPQLSLATLRKLLMPANSGSPDSIYVKNSLKLMEQGCAAR